MTDNRALEPISEPPPLYVTLVTSWRCGAKYKHIEMYLQTPYNWHRDTGIIHMTKTEPKPCLSVRVIEKCHRRVRLGSGKPFYREEHATKERLINHTVQNNIFGFETPIKSLKIKKGLMRKRRYNHHARNKMPRSVLEMYALSIPPRTHLFLKRLEEGRKKVIALNNVTIINEHNEQFKADVDCLFAVALVELKNKSSGGVTSGQS